MDIQEMSIAGVYRMQGAPFVDDRGWFDRLHCRDEMHAAGIPAFELKQANWSHTENRGAVRGLHYQEPPHTETKVVRCVRGAVVDFVVDLRRGSPSFLAVVQEELSDTAHNALVIPRGCAHGFQVLSHGADLLYLHDANYNAAASRVVHIQSPALRIALPLPISDMSDRDRQAPHIDGSFPGVQV